MAQEVVEVLDYDASTNTVTTRHGMLYAHADGVVVNPLFCNYDLDASDTDDFATGKEYVVTWTPDTGDIPLVDTAQVVKFAFSGREYEADFRKRFPVEYENRKTDIGDLLDMHYRDLRDDLFPNIQMDRVVAKDSIIKLFCLYARKQIIGSMGDDTEWEYGVATQEYDVQLAQIKNSTIWTDDDQDGVKDDSEIAPKGDEQYGSFGRTL